MLGSFRRLSLLAALLGVAPLAAAQENRTYLVRGKSVTLTEDAAVVAVRAKFVGPAPTRDTLTKLGDAAIKSQATLLKQPLPMNAAAVRPVTAGGLVLVPRSSTLTAKRMPGLAAGLRDAATEVVPVYRYGFGGGKLDGVHGGLLIVPTGNVLVRFTRVPAAADLAKLERELNLQRLPAANGGTAGTVVRFRRTSTESDPFAVCDAIRVRVALGVRWAEPEFLQEVGKQQVPSSNLVPNDPFFAKQWYALAGDQGINAPQAWAKSLGTDRITVAIVDDGVDLAHEDLRGKIVRGINVTGEQSDADVQPDPKSAHGTSCAGIIGAIGDNKLGITGLARHCKILPVKISNEEGFANPARIAHGMTWAFAQGAKLFNCSWGGGPPTNVLIDAIDDISDNGGLVICAAGNRIPAVEVFHPAAYERCMAIGSVMRNNKIFDYSCFGPDYEVSIAAPSGKCNNEGDIWTTDHSGKNGYNPGGDGREESSGHYTARFGGTSAACPVVVGVAALVWSTYPQLTPVQLRACLEQSARKIDAAGGDWAGGRSKKYGYGKVDLLGALTKAEEIAKQTPARNFARVGIKNADGPKFDPLAAATDDAAKTYFVRTKAVTVKPDPDWLVVAGAERDDAEQPEPLVPPLRILDPERRRAAFAPSEGTTEATLRLGKDGDDVFTLVRRTALLDDGKLKAEAAKTPMPYLSRTYRTASGDLIAPNGKIEVKLKSAEDRAGLLRYAGEAGLGIVLPDDDAPAERLTLRIVRDARFTDVFDAAEQLRQLPNVAWAEPSFLVKLKR